MSPERSFSQSEHDRCDDRAKNAGIDLLMELYAGLKVKIRKNSTYGIDLQILDAETDYLIMESDVAMTKIWNRWPVTVFENKDRYWLRNPGNLMILFNTSLDRAVMILGRDILDSKIIEDLRWNPKEKKMLPERLRAVDKKFCRQWEKASNGRWSQI